MSIFYSVTYSENGRVMFAHFDFFNEALEFINKVRQSGERATLRKIVGFSFLRFFRAFFVRPPPNFAIY